MTRPSPAEILLGTDVGYVNWMPLPDGRASVKCHNAIKREFNFFTTSIETAKRIEQWRNSSGIMIQDVPGLTIEQQEMCLSGMSEEDQGKFFR